MSEKQGGYDETGRDPRGQHSKSNRQRVAVRAVFLSSLLLALLHLLLFLLADCLRWLNLLLAVYHGGFALYTYAALQDPTGSDKHPVDPGPDPD